MSDERCTCPPMRDVFRDGVGTKEPCPVHETPEFLALLADVIVPMRRDDVGYGFVKASAAARKRGQRLG